MEKQEWNALCADIFEKSDRPSDQTTKAITRLFLSISDQFIENKEVIPDREICKKLRNLDLFSN